MDRDGTIGESDEDARVVASDGYYVGSASVKGNCGVWMEGRRAVVRT